MLLSRYLGFSSFVCSDHFQHIYSIAIAMRPATVYRFPF